jgi:hypothetical protein
MRHPSDSPVTVTHISRRHMDTNTFIAKLVEYLAWPVASVFLIALLRKELRTLLPQVRKLKAGPIEAEFERGAEHLKSQLPAQPKVAEALSPDTQGRDLKGLTDETSPRSAVLESWLKLENAANAALSRKLVQTSGPSALMARQTIRGLANTLQTNGLLHEGQVALFKELQHLRNEVVHTYEFTPTREAIVRYIDTANYLTWWLTDVAK